MSTAAVVTWQLEHRPHPEQGYRACLGLLALVRRYSAERLEADRVVHSSHKIDLKATKSLRDTGAEQAA